LIRRAFLYAFVIFFLLSGALAADSPTVHTVAWGETLYSIARAYGVTPQAIAKVKEIMAQQNPLPLGLRVAVVGGGCSGFTYQINFEEKVNGMDKTFEMEGLKVIIDQASLLYLKGTKIDYVESLEGTGFKFDNPNAKTTCGCGHSYST